jgi:hypothetical protein
MRDWRPGRRRPWAFALAAVACLAPPAGAQEISEEARKHFRAGVNYMQDPDGERVEDAYVEFKRAYELSKSPKILGNLGICAMRLERDGEAIEALGRYANEVNDLKPEDREQIQRDLQTLNASAVRLAVTSDLKEATVIDTRFPNRGAAVTNRYPLQGGKAEFVVRAGHHVVRLQTEGRDRGPQWQFDALGGTSQSHHFAVGAAAAAGDASAGAEAASRPTPVVPWVLLGLGGTALAGGAVTGVLALKGERDLEDLCPNNECPADSDYASRKRSTATLSHLTDGLLIGGGALAAVGAGWLLFFGPKATKAASSGIVTGGAACTPYGCSALLRARFLPRRSVMRRTLSLALVAGALAASGGCSSITDVDRFQAPLEDPDNPNRSLRFTIRGMDNHVSKYFEIRLLDGRNWVQFVGVSEKFESQPTASFYFPNVIPKRDANSYRLDFFGDMNDDRAFNATAPKDEAGNATAERDHSWRLTELGTTKAPEQRVRGDALEVVYLHNYQFEDLDTPKPEFTGGDAVVNLTNLSDSLNKRVEVRVTTLNSDPSVPPRTLGFYRIPRLGVAQTTATMRGIIHESGETFRVFVYVDANGNDEYDNPAAGGADYGWSVDAKPQTDLSLNVTFDPTSAGPANVNVWLRAAGRARCRPPARGRPRARAGRAPPRRARRSCPTPAPDAPAGARGTGARRSPPGRRSRRTFGPPGPPVTPRGAATAGPRRGG